MAIVTKLRESGRTRSVGGRPLPRFAVDAAMSADESRRVEGIVTAQLPSGLYQVQIDGEHRVTAHPAGGGERNFVRLLVGDRVIVELTERDGTRGRIIRKA
jgi:translation initiation factor IF-1